MRRPQRRLRNWRELRSVFETATEADKIFWLLLHAGDTSKRAPELPTPQSALEHIFKINIIVVKLSANLSQMIRTLSGRKSKSGRKGEGGQAKTFRMSQRCHRHCPCPLLVLLVRPCRQSENAEVQLPRLPVDDTLMFGQETWPKSLLNNLRLELQLQFQLQLQQKLLLYPWL